MADSRFADRIGEMIDLTAAERAALAGLEAGSRALRRGAVLVRDNEPQAELYVVKQGVLMTYVLLDDGSRQILRFVFPGEMVGFSALAYRRSAEAIAAVSDSVVAPFERAALTGILTAHPRLAAILMTLKQIERIGLTDRIASMGRTSAKARVAALLLDIRHQVAGHDRSPQPQFVLGLTQEEVGDATGLTAVHVNRMLRQLEDDGMIARQGGRITILDEPGLVRMGHYVNRRAGLDLGWMPAATG